MSKKLLARLSTSGNVHCLVELIKKLFCVGHVNHQHLQSPNMKEALGMAHNERTHSCHHEIVEHTPWRGFKWTTPLTLLNLCLGESTRKWSISLFPLNWKKCSQLWIKLKRMEFGKKKESKLNLCIARFEPTSRNLTNLVPFHWELLGFCSKLVQLWQMYYDVTLYHPNSYIRKTTISYHNCDSSYSG